MEVLQWECFLSPVVRKSESWKDVGGVKRCKGLCHWVIKSLGH